MPEEKAQETKQAAEKAKGGGKGLLVAGVCLLVIVGTAVGAWIMLFQGSDEDILAPENPQQVAQTGPPQIYSIGDFIVNMAPPDSETILRMAVDLAIQGNGANIQEVVKDLDARRSQIRDIVMTITGGKRRSDISGTEGREKMKAEIAESINRVLSRGKVEGVYFQEFVFQRM